MRARQDDLLHPSLGCVQPIFRRVAQIILDPALCTFHDGATPLSSAEKRGLTRRSLLTHQMAHHDLNPIQAIQSCPITYTFPLAFTLLHAARHREEPRSTSEVADSAPITTLTRFIEKIRFRSPLAPVFPPPRPSSFLSCRSPTADIHH